VGQWGRCIYPDRALLLGKTITKRIRKVGVIRAENTDIFAVVLDTGAIAIVRNEDEF